MASSRSPSVPETAMVIPSAHGHSTQVKVGYSSLIRRTAGLRSVVLRAASLVAVPTAR